MTNEQQVLVTANGFEPSTIRIRRGEPTTLVITRQTARTCAREIVIDELGVLQRLPLGQTVRITIDPQQAGELAFGCAMDKMIGGTLVIE
jgi:plastocyanin domain-containing protein